MITRNGQTIPGAKHGTMEITHVMTFGWTNALRGMRFPKNSDGQFATTVAYDPARGELPNFGEKDYDLMLRLTKAGRDHRKVLRMIHVQAALKMPISWWIQMDTYKVATVANSRSRMHKFGSEPLTRDDFYVELWTPEMDQILATINDRIDRYKSVADPQERMVRWREALDMLPMSYLQERMWDGNYETLVSMYHSRWTDKLKGEWHFFLNTMLESCPALAELVEASKNGRTMTTAEFEGQGKTKWGGEQVNKAAAEISYQELIKTNRERGHVK